MSAANRGNAGRRVAKTRIFIDAGAEVGEVLALPADEAHHIFKVLRGREGEIIEVVTSEQGLMLAEAYGDAQSAEAHILEEIATPVARGVGITLYQAVPKAKHMDLVVEKATELGVEHIVPLLAERGEIRPGSDKVGRWHRLAEAAARQSLRLHIPGISEPETFPEAIEEVTKRGERGVILHNDSELPTIEETILAEEPIPVFVGPEGGWSDQELRLAGGLGLRLAQMGPYRLRAETAGIVAVARTEAHVRHLRSLADGVREAE